MAEFFFYHLSRSPIENVLPDLLELCRKRDLRVCVRGTDRTRLEWLDGRIWMHRDDGFLPHGVSGGPDDQRQPILLTTGAAVNSADILMLIDGSRPDLEEASAFQRVCVLFDGHNDNAVDKARQDWKSVTMAQIPAQYWAQEDGRWIKKAESAVSG